MAANVKGTPLVTARTSGLSESASTTSDTASQVAVPKSWHDVLKVHPAAAEFDVMSHGELLALGEDIKARGLVNPIVYYDLKLDADSPDERFLLDGRNRLDAMQAVGLGVTLTWCGGDLRMTVTGLSEDAAAVPDPIRCEADPYEYVISANIRRRHLNAEQRTEAIAKIIARAPERSDRQIAKEIGVDHKTVGAARAKGEDVGRIPHVETRLDTTGRRQPGSKSPARSRGAAQPRSPQLGGRRKPDAAPAKLNSLAWSYASADDKRHFLSAIGFNDWWSCAPGEFREKARNAGNTIEVDVDQAPSEIRTVKLSTPPASAGEEDQAAGDPMVIPAALKRTPPTDRFGRPRPEPGSLLKPDKKQRSKEMP